MTYDGINRNCNCGHGWHMHVRHANGSLACKYFGCGCQNIEHPWPPNTRQPAKKEALQCHAIT